jgi:dTDP-4-amino-4,6-dideoxygalactose transaminase
MENRTRSPIYLSRPSLTDSDIEAVTEVLKSGNLVQGAKVLELEQSLNHYISSSHCSAVSNGTASLHLALLALGIGEGDEVIIPAFSYIATANVIELIGATPVFVDISLDTFNIDPRKIEEAISERTRCIMPVHEFGLCADMISIKAIASNHNLFIIEDAACAIGASISGQYAGTFGDFGSFSLHPRKSITSGEGGILTTNDANHDIKIKTLRNHGIAPNSYPMDFVAAGFNYRLTDFQAAMVVSQLNRLDRILAHKEDLAELYFELLPKNELKLPSVPIDYTHTWQTYHVVCVDSETRNELMEYLKEDQIFTNYGAQCIPEMTFYKNKYNLTSAEEFPNAFKAYSCGLALPLGENHKLEDIQIVSDRINQFYNDRK